MGVAGVAAPVLATEEAGAAGAVVRRTRCRGRCRHVHRCRFCNHRCRRRHACRHVRRHHSTNESPTEPPPTTPPVEPSTGASVEALHLASRFSYGTTPTLQSEMAAAGGHRQWFEAQLSPAAIADTATEPFETWWTSINLDHTAIWQRNVDEVEGGWVAMANYARWCLLRRIYSRRQVLEVMTEFWENHLHVPLDADGVFTYRAAYGKMIRSHALGRFDDMLVEAITHPAMGIFLNNAVSTKRAPNENLGRELLELHTVGRGNHSEDDVKNSARILTGYRVELWRTWRAYYDTASHHTGPVQVLGFSHANAAADGQPVTKAYLRYLASHPQTAERIARKLAVRFISDNPSAEIVAHLAQVYLASGTEIIPVLNALVDSAEFLASAGDKVRTPTDDLVATHRVLGTQITAPTSGSAAANAILWQSANVGQTPFGWSRPDGQPQDNASWSSASRFLASLEVHYQLSGGWWPKEGITYRAPKTWLPHPRATFGELVEHLSRELLGRPSTAQLLNACCLVVGVKSGDVITEEHPVVKWQMSVVLTTVLDSPAHMTR